MEESLKYKKEMDSHAEAGWAFLIIGMVLSLVVLVLSLACGWGWICAGVVPFFVFMAAIANLGIHSDYCKSEHGRYVQKYLDDEEKARLQVIESARQQEEQRQA